MKPLYNHQKEIIAEDKPIAGLFLGCGGGKTLTALMLARGKTLVVAPKTQVQDKTWEKEVLENGITIDLTVLSKEKFKAVWETLPRYDTLIMDEAHTMLGVETGYEYINKVQYPKVSQIYRAIDNYVDKHKPERIYPVTATIAKTAMTVWGVAQLLGRDWSFEEFRSVYYKKRPILRTSKTKKGKVVKRKIEIWTAKKDNDTKVRLANTVKKLGYTGRLQDWFDVPEQVYKNVWLDLYDSQLERIREAKLEFPEPIVRVGKIHQIENGILAGDEFNEAETFDNPKLDWLLEHAVEFPRMIVFVKFTAQIEMLYAKLKEEGYDVYTMTGKTKNRGELLSMLNNKEEYIFIVQSQISSGWELPECPVIVYASLTYSVVDKVQGDGRILRSNNIKKNLYINLVTKGFVDEAVFNCIKNKNDFIEESFANDTKLW